MSKFIFKKAVSILAAAAAVITPLNSFEPAKSADSAGPDEYHDDWLHVDENAQIVDMNGNPVWLTGVNWFGYNVGSQVFDGVWCANMHDCLTAIADHGFNLLRVPMSTEIILQWKNNEPDQMIKVGEWANPELTIEGVPGGTPKYSFEIWNMAVQWCRENGIKIMMDIHCATTNASGHNYPLWYDDNFSTDDWLEALEWFSDYYKDDDTIVAIDLKNEPHGKPEEGKFAKWDNSKDLNNWKYAAERGAKACLDQNPNLLIMVEGIEVYPKFDQGSDWTTPSVDYANYDGPSPLWGAWWGGNLRGVKDLPVDLGKYQSQLVYSPHDYGPFVHPQKWFHLEGEKPNWTSYEFDRESLLDEYWRDTWAYICEDKIAPLLMGEWGGFVDEVNDPSGANTQWLTILRDYMIEKHINHTFWCFNENSSDTGGLVGVDFTTWDEQKYEFVKPALWQDENGKFISLDHKIPMGKNGISLSDYYSTHSGFVDPSTNTGTKTTASNTTTSSSTTTTSSTSSTTKTTPVSSDDTPILYGDANCDEKVNMADAVLIMQSILNGDEFGIGKPDGITEKGSKNADCYNPGSGLTNSDALAIQELTLDIIKKLPVIE